MKTLIRAVELWKPGSDGLLLEHGGGWYGLAPGFGAASRSMCFGRAEGLPGRAWDEARPIVLRRLDGPYFRRTQAARGAGLTRAIAVPCFGANGSIGGVIVFFAGDDDERGGAIELWRNDPAESQRLTLADGLYGRDAEAFESASRQIGFERGSGLPGLAWQGGLPVFVEFAGRSKRFVRADSGVQAGIERGLALPCGVPGDVSYVLAFLCGTGVPVAPRYEIWEPDAAQQHLQRSGGWCRSAGNLARVAEPAVTAGGQGALGHVLHTGVPAFAADAAAEPGSIGRSAAAAGLSALVAMPLLRDGRVAAVVAWYF